MKDTVFLTGGTGTLGTMLAGQLKDAEKIYVLVRARDREEAVHRLKEAWHPFPELTQEIGTGILPVRGDLSENGLGIGEEDAEILRQEVTAVYHAAAETGLQKSAGELTEINRNGTARMIELASGMKNLRRFVYISTAYTAGTRSGKIMENDLPGTEFSTAYEKSKAEAEQLVRSSSLPFSICRPGMIVGHSKTGWTRHFNTVYYILKQYLTGRLNVFPVKKNFGLNIVPADYVAEAVIRIAQASEAEGRTFHLTCPAEKQPRASELADYVRTWAEKHLDTKLPPALFVPGGMITKAGLAYNRRNDGRKKNALTNLLAVSPYFSGSQVFSREETDRLCGAYDRDWHSFMDVLLDFACRKNFMEQTGRSVFEQADIRRASTRYPVNYYDVTSDGIRKVTGPEVNEKIRQITDALYAWGIRRGDRVALSGINSVDYMTLDMAIGKIGAVSVPIYYTTPAEEVQLLLDKSGSKWFFAGDRRIMKHIELLSPDIRVVAFSDGLSVHKSGVMHWEQFLYEAKEEARPQYPDPEDLATIRYTSGTTGEPKGVKFNFGQLAWMGEVLTNLLHWEDRNGSMRYLSFLPLSHVVEGILASYAPYYLLADVDYYFLNDFQKLTEALPKVRPTVFFSVPRFYEKLWDQLEANPLGRKYLAMKDGPAKKAAAAVLRTVILKKAGLDACRQLIVGSAPISEALLRKYRGLGIEIYNAYGQAEAPLITINRFGDNEIPTIGTPLPETEVTAAEDGELIVKGPQVCLGYYGLETDTIQNGVLKTGDLGVIHENGHITLFGRKKEMIITAYGKNISIPKIEACLKNISGVSEAVLIGEKRPYCTALLWLEREVPDLDQQIEAMNAELSHPEQIRKYRIIEKPLSIQAGELTPNLKVKRRNVEEHFRDVIEEMYRQ